MITRVLFLFGAFLSLAGCSEENGRDAVAPAAPSGDPKEQPSGREVVVPKQERFASDDRSLEEIMEDFSGSIDTFPTIDQDETMMKKNGRLYRRGLEDEPFTGTVVESFPDGSLSLSTTFYQGKPHGLQRRNFPDGGIATEIFFDKGVLAGTMSKWWKSGAIREEQYWSNGQFKGRRMWDDAGRMIREELVPED